MSESNRRAWLRASACAVAFTITGCSGAFSSSGEAEKIKGMAPGEYRDKVEEDQLEQARKSKKATGRRPSR